MFSSRFQGPHTILYSLLSRRLQRRHVQATKRFVVVVQLRGFFAAGALVPFGVLPRQVRANCAVLVAAPAADAGQPMAAILMPREGLQGGGPGLKAEAAPSQLGLVQEVHFQTPALAVHSI